MNLEYIELAQRTVCREYEGIRDRLNNNDCIDLLHAALGITTEYAEIGLATSVANQNEEIGDLFWYIALAFNTLKNCKNGVLSAIRVDLARENRDSPSESRLVQAIGDFSDCVKRIIFYGETIDDQIDNLWVSLLAIHGQIRALLCLDNDTIQHICDLNIAKLKKRYPEKFTENNALNRDLVAEQEILKNGE